MDQGAAKVIVQEFLGGVFDVIGAIAEAPFVFVTSDMSDVDEDTLAAVMEILPITVRAKLTGGGEAALLFSVPDIAKLLAITENSGAAKTELDETDLAAFEETANSMLSSGVTRLVRALGEEMAVESFEVVRADDAHAGAQLAFTGPATLVNYRFQSTPQFDSMGALLVSHALENRVPAEVIDSYAEELDLGGGKLVSDAEMQDILSGFGGDAPAHADISSEMRGNLDVIMDIELLATVRLGSIEMPLAEVLRLGPGSIIEVGQQVDDPVELLVNGRLVARGDVVVVDEKFGLRITEIVSRKERIESLR